MTSQCHNDLVEQLVAEGKQRSHFRRTVTTLVDQLLGIDEDIDDDGEPISEEERRSYRTEVCIPNRLPDAFEIVGDGWPHVLRIWEVEVTSLLTFHADKIDDYINFWSACDYVLQNRLTVELWTVDRFGQREQIDLEAAFYSHFLPRERRGLRGLATA